MIAAIAIPVLILLFDDTKFIISEDTRTPVEVKSWKKYTSKEYEMTFEYPEGWIYEQANGEDDRFFFKAPSTQIVIDVTKYAGKNWDIDYLMTEEEKSDFVKNYARENDVECKIIEATKRDIGKVKAVRYVLNIKGSSDDTVLLYLYNTNGSSYCFSVGYVTSLESKWKPTAEHIINSLEIQEN